MLAAALAELATSSGGPESERVRTAPTLADSFAEQWAYVESDELFNAVICSRRSGKTAGAVRRHAKKLIEGGPGTWTHFGSLIRRNARKHFWRPLKAWLDAHGWRYRANETEMILQLENGAWCQAFSCDDMSGIKAVQGDSSDLFTVDECHLPNDDVLEALVDVASPMLTDRGGMLDLLGLPPEVEGGFFANALDGGFAVYTWTMFDHDFPRLREEKLADVIELARRRGLPLEVAEAAGEDGRPRYSCIMREPGDRAGTGTHAIIARQYFGRRAIDPEKVAYEYRAGRNDYDPAAVNFDQGRWRHSAGLDLGHGDCDAIVVHSWEKEQEDRRALSRFAWKHNKLDVDDLALIVELVQAVYHPWWVGDTGGHGAVKVLATLAGRLGMVFAPKPPDVLMSARVLNDDYRTERLKHPTVDVETPRMLVAVDRMAHWTAAQKERAKKLLADGAFAVTNEVGMVSKTVNPRTRKIEINKHGLHSDISEANRYAHHAARHWAAKPAKSAETTDQRRERQYRERNRAIREAW